MDLPDLLD